MKGNFSLLSKPSFQKLSLYQTAQPISDETLLNDPHFVQLASNENPLGPSEKVKLGIEKQLNNMWRYPDTHGTKLKTLLAGHLEISAERITLGNGSLELINLLVNAFVEPNQEVIISKYAYSFYEICIQSAGGHTVICTDKNWGHNLSEMVNAITNSTKLIIIANPNNPTGTYLKHEEIENFLISIPKNVLVIVDEAYHEYVLEKDYAATSLLQKSYDNLIVTRSFSKIYGLAGLRLGYCIANSEISSILNRARVSFNVNLIALEAGCLALNDQKHVAFVTHYIANERAYLSSALSALGINFIPPSANFIAIEFDYSAQEIFDSLLTQGVLVRQLINYDMPNFLRVTIGKHEENEKFLNSLKIYLNQRKTIKTEP